jgi:hypothetical protein
MRTSLRWVWRGCVAVALVGVAGPVQAVRFTELVPRVSWSYTDSRAPGASHVDPTGDVPLGAWSDRHGRTHLSRVYATFDLTGLAGKHVFSAEALTGESRATDCDHRQIEVWRTADRPARPTWAHPPRELTKLDTIGGTSWCPASYLEAAVSQAVIDAVAAGQHRLSLELRVPAGQERDLALGRFLDGGTAVALSVVDNAVPAVPTQPTNGGQPCATGTPYPYVSGVGDLRLSAVLSDPDPADLPTGEFAYWPADAPDQRTVLTGTGSPSWAVIPDGSLTDGTTYSWAVRASDGTDTSAWSATCSFIADTVAPAAGPVVTSSDFPPDQTVDGGTPGQFTFTANGVADVAAYQYGWQDPLGVLSGDDPFLRARVRAAGHPRRPGVGHPVAALLRPQHPVRAQLGPGLQRLRDRRLHDLRAADRSAGHGGRHTHLRPAVHRALRARSARHRRHRLHLHGQRR